MTRPENAPATPQAVETTLTLIANLLGIHPETRASHRKLAKVKALLDTAANPDTPADDRQKAARRLASFARHHINDLKTHIQQNVQPLRDLEAARIAAGYSLPNTTEARLARRYEAAARREFEKSLTLLQKLRKNHLSDTTNSPDPFLNRGVSERPSMRPLTKPSPTPSYLDLLSDGLGDLNIDDIDDVDDETLATRRAEYQATLRAHNITTR